MGASVVLLLSWTGVSAQIVNSPSWAEQLYAELAKLPPEERQKRLEDGARKEGKVQLVSLDSGALGRGHQELFQKRYPFLKVEAAGMGSQDKAEQFIAEETAGRHLTDAMSIATPVLAEIIERNLIARYPSPAEAKILPQYRGFLDPEKRWLPWYTSEHGIAYNNQLVKEPEAPKSWEDLCKPEYRGKASYEPVETRFLLGIHALMGEDKMQSWLKCIGENEPILQRGHENRVRLMLAGDHPIAGETLLYNGTQLARRQKAPFVAVYSAPVLLDAIAVIINRNAPNPHAAALFADWTLSDESQQYMAASMRGVVTMKHPFFPEDVKLVTFNFVDKATVDRLHGYWDKYVTKVRQTR